MTDVVTHKFSGSKHEGKFYTIWALCGYIEDYDLDDRKKWQTPFIREDYTCEDCLATYAMDMLANVP